jgi:hypothetical protein
MNLNLKSMISLSFSLFLASSAVACSGAPTESVSHGESAVSGDGSCTTNADCGMLSYCAPADGVCGGAGTCQSRGVNLMCVMTVTPVCGCDGNTYRNACYAHKAGVAVASEGACPGGLDPFAQTLAGAYVVAQPSATGVQMLTIFGQGFYEADFADGTSEFGNVTSFDTVDALPYTFQLTSGGSWWTARVETDGSMTVTRADGSHDKASQKQ